MQTKIEPVEISQLAGASHRVLRNTYLLLALSLVPTALGAVVGMKMGFSFFAGSPLLGMLVFLGVAFGFFYGIERYKNSGLGVALLLGFTFFMGLMLSRILQTTLGLANGGQLIALAGGGTAAIFFVMGGIATTTKRDLSGLGNVLFAGMIVLLLAGLANVFFQIPAVSLAISAVAVLLFSAWLLFDINRIVQGGETNYVTATLSIYLNIYNIFTSLLHLLTAFGGERD